MPYNLFPAVDETYSFPPEVRAALATSLELRNTVIPMTTTLRNNLTGSELWDGRLILNTTTDRLNRYDLGSASWIVIPDESDITAAVAAAMPIGVVLAYGSSVAPSGWHLCDGSAHNSAALQSILTAGGHENPHLTPNLRDKFIAGDGGAFATSGGLATVILSVANLPSHDHGGLTQSGNATHSHGGSTQSANANHTHGLDYYTMYVTTYNDGHTGGNYSLFTPSDATAGSADYADAPHSHVIPSDNAAHTHGIPAQGSGTPHENLPPYYTLTYIIKKV
jgi:microcystin-dependent protein